LDASTSEIKALAKESREASVSQERIATELAANVRTYMKNCRESIYKLDLLVSTISNWDLAQVSTGNEQAIKQASDLLKEARNLKEKIDEDLKAISAKSRDLTKLGLVEQELQADNAVENMLNVIDEKNALVNIPRQYLVLV